MENTIHDANLKLVSITKLLKSHNLHHNFFHTTDGIWVVDVWGPKFKQMRFQHDNLPLLVQDVEEVLAEKFETVK